MLQRQLATLAAAVDPAWVWAAHPGVISIYHDRAATFLASLCVAGIAAFLLGPVALCYDVFAAAAAVVGAAAEAATRLYLCCVGS